jgi:predicted nucleotidyltransferase
MMTDHEKLQIGVMANSEIAAAKDIILKTVDCERIYLFGSHAYGTPHENSDYDFYVVLTDGNENPLFPVQRIYKNLRQIKRKTPVDILAAHKNRFDDISLLPTMERKIVREVVLLYENSD